MTYLASKKCRIVLCLNIFFQPKTHTFSYSRIKPSKHDFSRITKKMYGCIIYIHIIYIFLFLGLAVPNRKQMTFGQRISKTQPKIICCTKHIKNWNIYNFFALLSCTYIINFDGVVVWITMSASFICRMDVLQIEYIGHFYAGKIYTLHFCKNLEISAQFFLSFLLLAPVVNYYIFFFVLLFFFIFFSSCTHGHTNTDSKKFWILFPPLILFFSLALPCNFYSLFPAFCTIFSPFKTGFLAIFSLFFKFLSFIAFFSFDKKIIHKKSCKYKKKARRTWLSFDFFPLFFFFSYFSIFTSETQIFSNAFNAQLFFWNF